MWTPADRASVGDFGAGQALSDDRSRSLEPFIPATEPGGRPRETDVRRVLDASFYVVRTGRRWRHLPPPPTFPPWRTVHGHFGAFLAALSASLTSLGGIAESDGVWESVRHRLVVMPREGGGREASPTAAAVDTRSVETTEKGGLVAGTRPSARKGASATARWTRTGCCSAWSCTRPTSGTPTACKTRWDA